MDEAVEFLIINYIGRFKIDRMEGQSWRDRELWSAEVDLFFKANTKAIFKVRTTFIIFIALHTMD